MNTKGKLYKEVRKLAERRRHLLNQAHCIPYIDLPKPIPYGWWRYIAVREDVLRSSIGIQVKQVVDVCQHWALKKGEKKGKYHAHTTVPIGLSLISGKCFGEHQEAKQKLKPLSESQWEKAKFPDFFEKKWFIVMEKVRSFGTKNIVFKKYFPNVPDRMLEFKYKRAYISAVRDIDPKIEAEIAWIDNKIIRLGGWHLVYDHRRDEWDLSLDRERLRNKIADFELRFYEELE